MVATSFFVALAAIVARVHAAAVMRIAGVCAAAVVAAAAPFFRRHGPVLDACRCCCQVQTDHNHMAMHKLFRIYPMRS